MINLDKCRGSCNFVDTSETREANVKVFNTITNETEAKTTIKHISCDCQFKFNSTTCNSYRNGIMINVNTTVKIMVRAKKKKKNLEVLTHVFVRIANI